MQIFSAENQQNCDISAIIHSCSAARRSNSVKFDWSDLTLYESSDILKQGVTVMLGLIFFIIIAVVIYNDLEKTQRQQGGQPLTKSPIIVGGCGFVIFLIVIAIIIAYARG